MRKVSGGGKRTQRKSAVNGGHYVLTSMPKGDAFPQLGPMFDTEKT